ncbi:MAG: aminotransferase class I/II-fold pyridoxal phosphate-dependent enzyme [Candidatus Woesearchaeota archaeon]
MYLRNPHNAMTWVNTQMQSAILQDEQEHLIQGKKRVLGFLSSRGRAIEFPKQGIIAQAKDAKGKSINATIGMACEDDLSPMRLQSIAKNVLLAPEEIFTYASSFGKPELREAWKRSMLQKNPSLTGSISMPLPTNALTHALSIAGYLFADEGDKMILPSIFWGNYRLIFEKAYGTVFDTYDMFDSARGRLDIESFREKLSECRGKKIVLLNFPHNPTGYSPYTDEVQAIVSILKRQAETGDRIIAICDDAYFGLTYKEGVYKESIFSQLADAHENILAVKIDGASKEDYAWGLRVGFMTFGCKGVGADGYLMLEEKAAAVIRGNISNVSNLSQSLICHALNDPEYVQEKQEKNRILKRRFLAAEMALQEQAYREFFTPLPYNSGYFLCIMLKKGIEPENVRQILLNRYDTGVISLKESLRISFASVPEGKMETLFHNIYDACKEADGQGGDKR